MEKTHTARGRSGEARDQSDEGVFVGDVTITSVREKLFNVREKLQRDRARPTA